MCIPRATVSAVSCLVVPAFICIDLLISLVLKIKWWWWWWWFSLSPYVTASPSLFLSKLKTHSLLVSLIFSTTDCHLPLSTGLHALTLISFFDFFVLIVFSSYVFSLFFALALCKADRFATVGHFVPHHPVSGTTYLIPFLSFILLNLVTFNLIVHFPIHHLQFCHSLSRSITHYHVPLH